MFLAYRKIFLSSSLVVFYLGYIILTILFFGVENGDFGF